MRRLFGALLGCVVVVAGAARAEDKKGTAVELDGLKSTAPAEWQQREATNQMRFMEFKLPKVKGDMEDGDLVIFRGLGGSAKANIDRWKGQFIPADGKKIDDVAKVSEHKVGGGTMTYLDVQGTYKFRAQPFNPNSKEEQKPNFRMLAAHFEGPKNVYHFRLTGPAKTIDHYAKGFEEWLKNFK